jgi:PAS domain S-box-containing protein
MNNTIDNWHELLQRQLRKYWHGKNISPEMGALLDVISESYSNYSRDHFLLDRAMRLSSSELTALNDKLREELRLKIIAEETILYKENILRTINENLREAVFRSHIEGGLVYVNQAFVELFGYDSEEEVFKTPSENFYADTQIRERLAQHILSNGSIKSEEVLYKRKDGTSFWGLLSSAVSADRVGNQYYDGTLIDISRQKRIEESLREANEMLEKTNSELDRFVYSASHDLRAPLRSLLGLVQLIEMEKDGRAYTNLMRESINKLDDFIKDIVDYSRNSRLDVGSDLINFDKLIEESFQQLQFLPSAEKIGKIVQVDNPFPFYSDKKRLKIILNNLISNAISYHNPYVEKPYVKVEVTTSSEYSSLFVRDNGLGINDEHIGKIFDMFYRASTDSHGSGLGLYIVKETLGKLNGKINVISEKNRGSTFVVQIPNLIPARLEVTPSVMVAELR